VHHKKLDHPEQNSVDRYFTFQKMSDFLANKI